MTDLELCNLAANAYNDEATGTVAELEYTLYRRDDVTVIAVRGTELNSLLDIVRDVWAWPRRHEVLGWGHAGFIRGADRLFHDVRQSLSLQEQLILTGHSLGAIESLMLAMLLHDAGHHVKWVGFGCPRGLIGKRMLGFSARTYVNGSDLFTRVPVGALIRWQHPQDVKIIRMGDSSWFPSVSDHSISSGYYDSMSAGSGGITSV